MQQYMAYCSLYQDHKDGNIDCQICKSSLSSSQNWQENQSNSFGQDNDFRFTGTLNSSKVSTAFGQMSGTITS